MLTFCSVNCILLGCFGSSGSRSEHVSLAEIAPKITSISPTSGAPGTRVTVNGSNFFSEQDLSTVTFNGLSAGFATSWSDSQIVITEPVGATTGSLIVTVGGQSSNALIFTVTGVSLQSVMVSPNPGVIAVGSAVQFAAIGHFSDGSARNLTSQSQWTITNSAAATVGTSSGFALGVSASGPVTISAMNSGVSGSATFNVVADSSSSWTDAANLLNERALHGAVELTSGKVLVAGGFANGTANDATELFDLYANSWSGVDKLSMPAILPITVLLDGGQVLVAGGSDSSGITLKNSALFLSPQNDFFGLGFMTISRAHATAMVLPDGRVLIVGGVTKNGATSTTLSSAETFAFLGFSAVSGVMNSPRAIHTATLLNDGRVLIAGGLANDSDPSTALATAEIFDPATNTFASTGSMTTARHNHTATLLNNGKVLIAGGENASGILTTAELYDPTTGTFTATGGLNVARSGQLFGTSAALLNDGTVLIPGGANNSGPVASTESYDPISGTFKLGPDLNTARSGHSVTLLPSGQVLVAGGFVSNPANTASAEVFRPINFTPENLVSISLTPLSPVVNAGETQRLTATGTFTDNSTQILSSVIWYSSDPTVVTVTNDSANKGVVFGFKPGSATISAHAGTVIASVNIIVQ